MPTKTLPRRHKLCQPPNKIRELREHARSLALPWPLVCDVKRDLAREDREAKDHPRSIRQVATYIAFASTPYRWSWWRIALQDVWGEIYAERDHTAILGYDEIHQQVATQFREFDADDGEERLFAFLMSPFAEHYATAAELYQQAIDLLLHNRDDSEAIPCPF